MRFSHESRRGDYISVGKNSFSESVTWRFCSDVLELRNFLKHRRNRATVVTRMYAFVYPHAPAQPLLTRGCAQVNVYIYLTAYGVGLLLCLFCDARQCEGLKTWNERRVRHHAFCIISLSLELSTVPSSGVSEDITSFYNEKKFAMVNCRFARRDACFMFGH